MTRPWALNILDLNGLESRNAARTTAESRGMSPQDLEAFLAWLPKSAGGDAIEIYADAFELQQAALANGGIKPGDFLHGTSDKALQGILRAGVLKRTSGAGVYTEKIGAQELEPGGKLQSATVYAPAAVSRDGGKPVLLRVNVEAMSRDSRFDGASGKKLYWEDNVGYGQIMQDVPLEFLEVFDPKRGWVAADKLAPGSAAPSVEPEAAAPQATPKDNPIPNSQEHLNAVEKELEDIQDPGLRKRVMKIAAEAMVDCR